MQGAVRRVLQSGLLACSSSSASAPKALAAEFSGSSSGGGSSRFCFGASGSHFHVPSFYGSKSSSSDEQQQQQQQRPSSHHPLRLPGLTQHCSPPLLPFAARAYHALGPRLSSTTTSAPLGLGLGLGLRPRSKPMQLMQQQQQIRPYGTEGELLGAAYLFTTDIMFWSGLIGAVVFRRNIIVMLLCTEIVMLACNMNFLFASAYLNDMTGVIMSITITTIAACETAIGLALCVTYFHIRSASDVEALNLLK